jgi:hypothetical protein
VLLAMPLLNLISTQYKKQWYYRCFKWNGIDITNTRAPSLRDLVKPDGSSNGSFMHRKLSNDTNYWPLWKYQFSSWKYKFRSKIKTYGFGQSLNLTAPEVNALVALLKHCLVLMSM